MSKTISNSISTGVTLTADYDPLFITGTGSIVTSARAAIYGNSARAWQVANAGLLDGLGSFGIDLLAGSTVTNTGTIEAAGSGSDALRIDNGAGTVSNQGTMTGGFDGIALTAGGSVTNTGTIGGRTDLGVAIGGGAGTVTNYGTIAGGVDAIGFSGSYADRVIIDPGAVFQGVVKGGSGTNTLELAAGTSGATGTLSDFAAGFTNFGTIAVDSGALWEVDGALTGTLENAGFVETTVTMAAGGSVLNTGTINAGTASYGITLLAGGTVSNTGTSALIEGARYGIRAAGAAAVITNAGTILGASGADGGGIGLYDGGTVTNTGTIIGSGNIGVYLDGGGTVANYGTIEGVGTAVYFKGGNDNLLIVGPGASFTGKLEGYSVGLELAAGSQGAIGTVSNFYTEFAGLSYLVQKTTIAAGANWIFGAPNLPNYTRIYDRGTLNSAAKILNCELVVLNGASFGNSGTVATVARLRSGVALQNGGTVENMGLISAPYGTGVEITYGGTLINAGTIIGSENAVVFMGTQAGRMIVDPGAVFTGTVVGDSGTNTLELAAGSTGATGTLSGFGTSFTNFTTLTVDTGADWQLDGVIGTTVTVAASGTVDNTGTVQPGGTAFYGVQLQGGGGVTNSGTITAPLTDKGQAVRIDGGAGTVSNIGKIVGGGDGVVMTAGGYVFNSGSIGGTGKVGIYIGGAAGTVTNTGTVSGGTYAVEFHGSGTPGGFADRLIIDPGAVFQGQVQGGGADSTIELAAGTAGATGTLSAFGASFTNFGSIVIDSGAKWALDGASPSGQQVTLAGTGDLLALGTPQNFADAIVGFGLSDKLDLTGLAYSTGATATLSGDTLTVTSGSTTDTFTLDGVPSGTKFEAVDDGAPSHGTLVEEVVCYCRGTRILTPSGEIPVEALRIGDVVNTLSRGLQPIRWIGSGRVMVPPGRRSAATPVIVRRDALAPGVPHRDLHITKGHALYLQGAFIPAEFLVNHRSILWDDAAKEVEFYHVELNSHEVMLAEGAPAESYRDEGNRWMFANANPAWDKPGVAPHAPVLTGGARLDAIWAQLLQRSGERLRMPTTSDPDLHLLVDGARIDARRVLGEIFVFPLPASAKTVVIASRAAAQDELGLFRDPRRLGIAVGRIELCCGGARRLVVGAEALTGPGFHGYEPAEDCTWTNGHAALPPALLDGADALHIRVRHTTQYAQHKSRRAA